MTYGTDLPAWLNRAAAASPEGLRPVIRASWERCAARGLAPAPTPQLRAVDAAELERRLRANESLVLVARRHLRWLSSWLGEVRHVAYAVDADAVVLWSVGDEEIVRSAGLAPGFVWSEELMGTNGAGTALVEGQPVAVFGCEHYVAAWQDASCMAAPIHGADGRIAGAIDLTTPEQQAAPELLGLVAQTAVTIEQELRSLQLEAERTDREALLASVAHDLRGPNSVVSLIADALPAAEIEQVRGRLKRASSRIEGLVSDLLDLSKVTAGRFHLAREPGDLPALLGEVVDLFQPLAAARRIALVFSRAPDAAGTVAFDRGQLHRALSNLLQNALKFTPPGGRIEVRLEAAGDELLVTVSDTGPGVPPAERDRIFEPYFSGHARSDGTGLGLAIASGIVKAHGGWIRAESAPEGGARFVLALPAFRSSGCA